MNQLKSIKGNQYISKFDYAVFEQALKFYETQMPNCSDLEEPVIGALLISNDNLPKVKNILQPDYFYQEHFKDIYSGIIEMNDKNMTIDLLTVVEYFRSKKVTYVKQTEEGNKKVTTSLLEKIGGPIVLTNCQNRVTSAANIEAHARYIQDKFLQRELLYKLIKGIKDIPNLGTFDIFNYRNNFAEELKVNAMNDFFETDSINDNIISAEAEPDIFQMIGSLWMQKQIAIMFADSGMGKSVLAFQMAHAISSGKPMFQGIMNNECERQVVLLVDFEYSNKQIQKRYSDESLTQSFQFDEFFLRATVNNDFEDYTANMEKFVVSKIEEAVVNTHADVLIIDNMSFIMDEATDNSVAIKFMKAMKRMRKKHNLSILVLGHVPKRDRTRRFTKDDLAGGKALSNFVDSVFAIGQDANDETIKYIVQVKSRDGEMVYGSENVIKTTIEKGTDMFLCHRFLEFGIEDHMLLKVYDEDGELELIKEAIHLQREENYSYRDLERHYNKRWSANTFRRRIKKYKESIGDWDELS